MKKWTDEEIEYLKENYPTKTNKELMKIMKISWNRLVNIASKLKLNKSKETLSKCYLGVSSERMKRNNPMNNPKTIEKMRQSKINYYKNLRRLGIPDKRKKYKVKGYRINLEEQKQLIKENYDRGYTLEQVGKLIGVSANTIKRRMIRWGMLRRKAKTIHYRFRADDGHIVKSSMELFVDNWLFHNGISHIYEKNLGETKFQCDFYIPETNTYIEVFGLTNETYKFNMKRKLKVYEGFGLLSNLIMIFPRDKISDKLKFLLSISKVQNRIEEYEIKN